MSSRSKKKIYIKRIISDIAEISSDYMEKIHIWYNEENITEIKALIIGPEDTPYEDGFYFFSLKFPQTYPFTSPSAKFETINGKIRFNPNLYETGKVCLSILGTWNGPKWSSVQTLNSVLLSIQSLLNENPICNEPGWENYTKDEPKSIEYNEYVRYHNYSFAILHVLKNNNFFPYFNEIVQNYFVKNYERIRKKLVNLKINDNKKVKTFIWNKSTIINYTNLINEMDEIFNNLKNKNFDHLISSSVHTNQNKNTKKLEVDI